jgi:hypothetical protein
MSVLLLKVTVGPTKHQSLAVLQLWVFASVIVSEFLTSDFTPGNSVSMPGGVQFLGAKSEG